MGQQWGTKEKSHPEPKIDEPTLGKGEKLMGQYFSKNFKGHLKYFKVFKRNCKGILKGI